MFDWRELALGFLRFCLFWLVATLAFYFTWTTLLRYTLLSGDVACAVGLTFASVLLLAAVRSTRRQRAQQALLDVSPSLWRDGQAVAVAGRLGSNHVALKAPISSRPCALYQHQLRRECNDTTLDYGRGIRLAEPVLSTASGLIELKGLPTLEGVATIRYRDHADLHAYARHLLSDAVELATTVAESVQKEPPAGVDVITGGGRDAEGQIAHERLWPKHMYLLRDPIPWDAAKALRDQGQTEAAITMLADAMRAADCEVSEQMLAASTEVCVFGTWCAGDRRIAIGPCTRLGRQHALIGIGREAWLSENREGARWRIKVSLGLLLAMLVPLLILLTPSISARPWAAGLVSLPQLWLAVRGNPDAIRPLLGSTTRPDAVAKAIEARRDAETQRRLHERGFNQPSSRPPEPLEADRLRAIEAMMRFNVDINAANDNGRLLLMNARGATLDFLLSHGANPRLADTDGWTPLHAAVGAADPERIETLLRAGADPKARDVEGNTALDYALAYAAASRDSEQAAYFDRVVGLLRGAGDDGGGGDW